MTYQEWFPWRKSSKTTYPWLRQLDSEFLKFELKRIKEIAAWLKTFQELERFKDLSTSVSYYVVPIVVKQHWLDSHPTDEWTVKGLSVLRNWSVRPQIAFFPNPRRKPDDYSLIRIDSCKKVVIMDGQSTLGLNAIEIAEWRLLDSHDVYPDVSFEPAIVSHLFLESFDMDKRMAESMGAPLASSPFEIGSVGGISLASVLDDGRSAGRFAKITQQLSPPEYRTYFPPKGALKGGYQKIDKGVKILLAERIHLGRNLLSSKVGYKHQMLREENTRRRNFQGEYSLYGSLVETKDNRKRLFERMFYAFFESEVSLVELREILESGNGLRNLERSAGEDIWLQIIHMRQIQPKLQITKEELDSCREKLRQDMKVRLAERELSETQTDIISSTRLDHCLKNVIREARSLARSNDKEVVDMDLLMHARGNFVDRLGQFVGSPVFLYVKFDKDREEKNFRTQLVRQALLDLRRGNLDGIWEKIGETGYRQDFFDDKDDLDRLMKWMWIMGQVYKKPKEIYGLV